MKKKYIVYGFRICDPFMATYEYYTPILPSLSYVLPISTIMGEAISMRYTTASLMAVLLSVMCNFCSQFNQCRGSWV